MEFDLRSRALDAIQDGQFEEAERDLRRVLADDPHDAVATAVLALCLAELGRDTEAAEVAARATTLEPYLAYPHWMQGALLARRGRFDEALPAAQEALRLDPEDPDHHALLAQLAFGRERWNEALGHAEDALALDPSHDGAATLRGLALRQLGRAEEATEAFRSAMEANPLNAFAAAGKGWMDLAAGRTADADLSFRDALLFDPTADWAREGLLAALKSRSPVYRQLLRFFLWMNGRTPRERTMVIIVGLLGYNALRRVARANPELAPFIWPLLVAYLLFVVMTWIADPLLDLMLWFDAAGRRLVSADRLRAGQLVGGTLALGAAVGLASLLPGGERLNLTALGFAALSLTVAGIFECARGWPRRAMAGYALLLAGLLVGSVFLPPTEGPALAVLALVGVALGTWLARGLGAVRPKAA